MREQWWPSIHHKFGETREDVDAGKMRYLAVQEDGYGVGVPQTPNEAGESMMAATGDTDPQFAKKEQGHMISNLPLLFANGYPTSLDKISLNQLERFITFLVQCSLGYHTAQVISEPQWWPKEVKFSNPLVRPKKINDSWMANLKKLVFRCYTYHRSEYLLRFCSYLAQYPHDKLYYINNWDSTTSLYHKGSGKLLVTFRNENMNYDKVAESPRRSLLPPHGSSSNSGNKSKQPQQQQQQSQSLVVIESPLEEIYLCDNCDAEFVGLEQMKDHEKTCGEQIQGCSVSRPQTPYEIPLQTELPQNQFLEYFSLFSEIPPSKTAENCAAPGESVSYNPTSRSARRVRTSVNLARCPTIPFSSPVGLAMIKKSKMMTEGTQQERLERIERHLTAPALGKSARPKWLDRVIEYNRWVVTYKPNRERPPTEEQHTQGEHHVHEYKFGSRRGKPLLSLRSQLLFIACKPIYVSMTRLSAEGIEELKRDPLKYRPPIRRITSRPRPRPLSKVRQAQCRSVSLKRKQPMERLDSNLVRLVDVRTASILPTLQPAERAFEPPGGGGACNDLAEITVIKESPRQTRSPPLNSEPPNKILIVDLCSSDEESENPPCSSDENRDPLRRNDESGSARTSFMKNLALNKFRSKACVYPADSTSDWLRDNVLTDDNDKCGNKCLGNVVLETCTSFSPILKPAP